MKAAYSSPQGGGSAFHQPPSDPRGGGVLGLEKGTDCGPTAVEQWLSRPKMAVLLLHCIKGGLSEYFD